MAGTQATLYEIKNGAAWITLNRPENRNALSSVLVTELYDHLLASNANDAVRSIVITGNGPAFCAGFDLGAMAEGALPSFLERLGAICRRLRHLEAVVVAEVHGPALAGGLEITLSCDLVVASQESRFGIPEVKRSLIAAAPTAAADDLCRTLIAGAGVRRSCASPVAR